MPVRSCLSVCIFAERTQSAAHSRIYGDDMAAITIADGTVLEGALPNKAFGFSSGVDCAESR